MLSSQLAPGSLLTMQAIFVAKRCSTYDGVDLLQYVHQYRQDLQDSSMTDNERKLLKVFKEHSH